MKAMNVSSALSTISSMPAMAKLRLLVDFANMADRIRKIRFTPGMAYNISVPIQFSTEGCLLLLLLAMVIYSSPMESCIFSATVRSYPYSNYIIHVHLPCVK